MKKNQIFLLFLLIMQSVLYSQNVGINDDGSSPNTSAMLDVKSTSKGLLIPRLTTAQRDAISSPATGLMIFQTDNLKGFYYYSGFEWKLINEIPSLEINDLSDGRRINTSIFLGLDAGKNISSDYNVSLGDYTLSEGSGGMDNVAVGYNALKSNTIGNSNTAVGSQSLQRNTEGEYNMASGREALYYNITGDYNTAIGAYALNNNTIASYNTAIGYSSLLSNTIGESNIALGYYSLRYNTQGNNNIAIGNNSLNSNIIGSYNIAIGGNALFRNIDGNSNSAFGYNSLYYNTANNNTAYGYNALNSNTIGERNTASGGESLASNINGDRNSAYGFRSLYNNQTGHYNIAVGYYSLYYNTTGDYNVAIGMNAGSNSGSDALQYCTFLGNYAQANQNYLTNAMAIGNQAVVSGSNRVRIGNTGVTQIGGEVSWSTLSDGRVKENVEESVIGIDFIMKLRPVNYTINKKREIEILGINKSDSAMYSKTQNQRVYSGFIAQEVEEIAKQQGFEFSGVCKPENENDLYSIRYSDFVVPIIKAMQEQQQKIEELQKQVEALKSQNN